MEGPVQRIVKQSVKNELPFYLLTQNYEGLQANIACVKNNSGFLRLIVIFQPEMRYQIFALHVA